VVLLIIDHAPAFCCLPRLLLKTDQTIASMRLSSSLINVVVATLVAAKAANSFVLPSISSLSTTPRAPSTSTITGTSTTTTSTSIILKSESNDTNQNQDKNQDKNEDESSSFSSSEAAWDATVDYDKEWPDDQAPPDPSSAWDALPNLPQVQAAASKLGIDISLEPLSPAEAEELREQAKEIISSNIDQGIEDIEKMRKRMNKDLEQNARVMQVASELRADEKSRELMSKIDKLTEGFLESTKDSRTSTKRAAAASKAMEGRDAGIEMGTWGTLGGRAVVAGTSTTSGTGTLLGSVENAKRQSERMEGGEEDGATTTKDATEVAGRTENRIVVIADIQQVRKYTHSEPITNERTWFHGHFLILRCPVILFILGSLGQTIDSHLVGTIRQDGHSGVASRRLVAYEYHALGRQQCGLCRDGVLLRQSSQLVEQHVGSIVAQNVGNQWPTRTTTDTTRRHFDRGNGTNEQISVFLAKYVGEIGSTTTSRRSLEDGGETSDFRTTLGLYLDQSGGIQRVCEGI
jgi:hypothetical protein